MILRADSYDRQKIGAVLSSVSNIIFRLDSFEHARQVYQGESLSTLASETAEEMRDALTSRFALLKDSVVNNEQVPAFTDESGKMSELVTDIREAGKRGYTDKKLREEAVQILLITGFYQSLASSLEECRGYVNRLNWNVFDQAYF